MKGEVDGSNTFATFRQSAYFGSMFSYAFILKHALIPRTLAASVKDDTTTTNRRL